MTRPLLAVGQTMTFERTFDHDDVLAFLRVSHDAGAHHAAPGPDGRRLVHGLLTATIPTKLGGDLDYLAREMHFEFTRAVYTGDTISCTLTITELEERADRYRLALSGAATNQHGEEVLRFASRGVVRR
jgi:3-hydroxybutyryl-CoA dehydratase